MFNLSVSCSAVTCRTFNPYTFNPYTFNPYTFNPYTFNPYTFNSYTFNPYTFNPYTFGVECVGVESIDDFPRWRHINDDVMVSMLQAPFWHSTMPSLTQHKSTSLTNFVTCSPPALVFSCLSKIVIPSLTLEKYFMSWIWILDQKIFVLVIFFHPISQ